MYMIQYDKVLYKTIYIIIRVHSEFLLVASCVLLKYKRTDDVNWWRDLIYFAGLRMIFVNFIII